MRALLLVFVAACTAPANDSQAPAPVSDCAEAPAGTEPPAAVITGEPTKNLLMISIDTLRRDRVGRYSGLDTTPFLDARLAEALVLDDMRACSNWTLPGVSCALSGMSPLERGIDPVSADPAFPTRQLPADTETLATWLAAAGFDTRLASGSRLFSDAYPIGNGFGTVVYDDDARAGKVAQLGLEAIDAATGPWYVHVHFRDPHSPYDPPDAYQGALAGVDLGELDPRTRAGIDAIEAGWRSLEPAARDTLAANIDQLYQGELRYLDDQLEAFWAALAERGVLDDTLVVFWSDHGEQFFEYGGFQHEASLHHVEGMAIGAFWASGLAPTAWEGPTTQVDVTPTTMAILGQSVPASVTGHVVGTAPVNRVRVSSAVNTRGVPILAVDQSGWRMFYSWTGQRSLHDLGADPSEVTNLHDTQTRRVECLWEHLAPAVAQIDPANAGAEAVRPEP